MSEMTAVCRFMKLSLHELSGGCMYYFMVLFLFLAGSSPAFGFNGSDGYVEVDVEYTSIFPGYIEIKDEVCRPARNIECEKAWIRLRSESCQRGKTPDRCSEAAQLLESSFCIPGLIYEGRALQGDIIRVAVCTSSGGYGNLSVRDIKNTRSWNNYPLLTNGNKVKYP